MSEFMGETFKFWCGVRAAMRKAKIDTPEQLEAVLGVSRPSYIVHPEIRTGSVGPIYSVVELRPNRRVVCQTTSRDDAERVHMALAEMA